MSIIRDVKEMLDEGTWLDEPFKVLAPFPVLAAICRNKVFTEVSTRKYYPNIYTLFVGESGCGKGVVIDDVIRKTIEIVDIDLFLGSTFTPEGLVKKLSKRESGYGIICNDEMSDIISDKKYMSGINDVLIGLYNSSQETYSKTLVKGEYMVKRPCVSMALGIQPDKFLQLYDNRLLSGGLIPRMIIASGRKLDAKNVRIDKKKKASVLLKCIILNELIKNVDGEIYVDITEEAIKDIFDYQKGIADKVIDSEASGLTNRVSEQIIKVGMLMAVDRWIWKCEKCESGENSELYEIYKLCERGEYQKAKESIHKLIQLTHFTHLSQFTPQNNQIWDLASLQDDSLLSFFREVNVNPRNDALVIDSYIAKKAIHTIDTLLFGRGNARDVKIEKVIEPCELLKSGFSLINAIAEAHENAVLSKVKRVIKRLVENKMCITENNEVMVRRSDVLRYTHLTASRLTEIENTLIDSKLMTRIDKSGTKYYRLIDGEW